MIYIGKVIQDNGRIEEISSQIYRCRITFANVQHLWKRFYVGQPIDDRACRWSARSVMPHGYDWCSLHAIDIKELSIFHHRCL